MKTHPKKLRTAALALFASAAFINAPVFGQDAPVVAPPPPVQAAPPAPVSVTPPAIRPAPAPAPAPQTAPAETQRATPAPTETRRTARAPERATRTANRPAPVAAAPAPAPEAAPAAPAPAPAPLAEAPPPVVEPAPATPAPVATDTAPEAESSSFSWLVAAAGLALVIALAGFFFLRRRRSAEEDYYYEEPIYEEPAAVAEPLVAPERDYQPAIVTPAFRRPAPVAEPEVAAAAAAGSLAVHEADPADVEALNASSSPEGHRPWLEFLMRPVRAGTTDDEALVEFELTVGNTGTVAAEDVRISAWMLADAGSDAENALIEPPADAASSETRIAPGDGAKVDASIALPRARLRDAVLPVVVADARYRLPGGGEGRTSARFAVGLPSGDGLQPFAVALGDGLSENVEARLEGEAEHV